MRPTTEAVTLVGPLFASAEEPRHWRAACEMVTSWRRPEAGAGARPSPLLSSRPSTMPSDPRERENHEGDVTTERKNKLEKVRRYKVLLHNDDYTTMEFVVLILMKFFYKTETEATHIMLSVHHKGHGVAGVYTKDVAETKVAQVLDYAKEHGMPLRLTAEPE
ncbi:ATP-dependent Clp protease adaptor protein ClpS [Minicystis rosea]|nr:ATP-dependent Clp protease adaptor protein ClpS [Minicystis rosea]